MDCVFLFFFGLFLNRGDSYDILLAGVYTAYGISLSGGDSQAHCTHSNSPGTVWEVFSPHITWSEVADFLSSMDCFWFLWQTKSSHVKKSKTGLTCKCATCLDQLTALHLESIKAPPTYTMISTLELFLCVKYSVVLKCLFLHSYASVSRLTRMGV